MNTSEINNQTPGLKSELLRVKEVAKMLNLTNKQVHRLVDSKKWRYIDISAKPSTKRCIRVYAEEVNRYREENPLPSQTK